MTPSLELRLKRMGECQSDLAANGIDLACAGERATRRLVRRHLDYFQLMLGYDASENEVVSLAQRVRSDASSAGQRLSRYSRGRGCERLALPTSR